LREAAGGLDPLRRRRPRFRDEVVDADVVEIQAEMERGQPGDD
jgi:hypothetical protein